MTCCGRRTYRSTRSGLKVKSRPTIWRTDSGYECAPPEKYSIRVTGVCRRQGSAVCSGNKDQVVPGSLNVYMMEPSRHEAENLALQDGGP